MNGSSTAVSPRRALELGQIAEDAVEEVVLARGCDVLAVREATLLVRVHEMEIGNGAEIRIAVRTESPCAEDPFVDFVSTDQATLRIHSGIGSAPLLLLLPVPAHQGALLRIVARATMGPVRVPLRAVLSAELVTKA